MLITHAAFCKKVKSCMMQLFQMKVIYNILHIYKL
jgi:hypothetical protein